jgi:hypothetical protein
VVHVWVRWGNKCRIAPNKCRIARNKCRIAATSIRVQVTFAQVQMPSRRRLDPVRQDRGFPRGPMLGECATLEVCLTFKTSHGRR